MIRIGNTVIASTLEGWKAYDVAGTLPPVTEYPPVSTGRLWGNLNYLWDGVFLIDAMRQCAPLRAQSATEWNVPERIAEFAVNADGYPTVIPPGLTASVATMESMPAAAASVIGGRYKLRWNGTGTAAVNGGNQTSGPGWVQFDYQPGGDGSLLNVQITSTDAADPLRDLQCYMLAHEPLLDAGKVVHPAWVAKFGGIGLLRFMQAQRTNESTQVNWSDAAQPSSLAKGISWQEMAWACNDIGAHGWFNFGHATTVAYAAAAATVIHDNLNPALVARFEDTNEAWNYANGFAANGFYAALAQGKPYGFEQVWAGRSAEKMRAVSQVFAGQMHRVKRMLGVQTGGRGLEQGQLYAAQWVAEEAGRPIPHEWHDALACTGYFNCDQADWPAVIASAEADRATGLALLLVKIREDIERHRTNHFPHWRAVADSVGLDLEMYEGKEHLQSGPWITNQALASSLVNEVNRGPLIVDLYERMIRAWEPFGDGPMNKFVLVQKPSATGEFALLHHLADDQPRYQAAMQYNAGTFPAAAAAGELPLNAKIVIEGHSITAGVAQRSIWVDAITAMGGVPNLTAATGPNSSFRWREEHPVETGTPDNVHALLQVPGAQYDVFLSLEAHGPLASKGIYNSVAAQTYDYIPGDGIPPDAFLYGSQWYNRAAATGAQGLLMTFWPNDPNQVFGPGWRAAMEAEKAEWTPILNYINANKLPGTPDTRVVPLLEVWCDVYDAAAAGTLTGMPPWFVPTYEADGTTLKLNPNTGLIEGDPSGMYEDDVHILHPVARWIQLATMVACVFRRHPDQLPANAGPLANISPALAAQLRTIVWAACLNDPRTGLSA